MPVCDNNMIYLQCTHQNRETSTGNIILLYGRVGRDTENSAFHRTFQQPYPFPGQSINRPESPGKWVIITHYVLIQRMFWERAYCYNEVLKSNSTNGPDFPRKPTLLLTILL